MDTHSPTVEPTRWPNLRRVPPANAGHPGDERAYPSPANKPRPRRLSTPETSLSRPRKRADVRVRGVREERRAAIGTTSSNRLKPSARRPGTAGAAPRTPSAERVPAQSQAAFFSGRQEPGHRNDDDMESARLGPARARALARARRGARWGCGHRSGFHRWKLSRRRTRTTPAGSAEKDAAVARLAEQRRASAVSLRATETLAERQAERETSIEKHLTRLERKVQAYRETLRKYAEISRESSSDASPSPSPWGSRRPSPASPKAAGR